MKRTVGAFFFALVALTTFAARGESVLRVREVDDLKGFDPIYTSDYMVREHGYLVYDALFAMDESFTPRPQMVDHYEVSTDKLAWTLHLRPGQAFSDGQKVTAADVIASIKRWGDRDGFGQMLTARTAKLEEVDPATVRIVLKQPWGLVPDALGKPSSNVPFIMPARIAAIPSDKQISEPIGSGPFIMRPDLWVHGAKIVYERNPNYVPRNEPANGLAGGKRALVDRVELDVLPDPATAAAALQKGEIDLFDGVPPDLAPALTHAKGVKLMPADTVGQLLILRPNSIQPPFDDAKMRQALGYAIDQTQFRDLYSTDQSLTRTCDSFLACTSPYATNVGWPKLDLEKARALVQESHYDGKPVVLLDVADYFTHPHALLVAQMLKEIGVNAEVQGMDSTTWVARRAKREGWNLAVIAPSGIDAGDPLSMFALRANCDKAWYGWPCDDTLEKLRTQYADATDVAARKALVEKIQARALEVGPYWPLGMVFGIRGYREEFAGFPKSPVPVYWNIERK
jgi:peptide/nickel transport system substrate-binding protein